MVTIDDIAGTEEHLNKDVSAEEREKNNEIRKALTDELETYKRIQDNAIEALWYPGVKITNKRLIERLVGTGRAWYDGSISRMHLSRNLVEDVLDSAPKSNNGCKGEKLFGIGGIPSHFYKHKGGPMQADESEFKEIIEYIKKHQAEIGFLSQPVAVMGVSTVECNKIMDCVERDKITYSNHMGDIEFSKLVKLISGRKDWYDSICGFSNIPLVADDNSMNTLLRSAEAGIPLRLTTLNKVGEAGYSPEIPLTIAAAEFYFMLTVAQIVKPRINCVNGGILVFAVKDKNNLRAVYRDDSTNLLEIAASRFSRWANEIPTYVIGGINDEGVLDEQAHHDSMRGKETFLTFGGYDNVRSLGMFNQLLYFALEKLKVDLRMLEDLKKNFPKNRQILPLKLPKYLKTLNTIERVGSGDYWNDVSTLEQVMVYHDWKNDLMNKGLLTKRIMYSSNKTNV